MDTLPETEYRIVAAFNDAEFERAPHDRRVWTPEIVFPDDRFIDVAEVPVPELGGYLASLGPGDVFSAFGTSDNAWVVCYRKKAYGWTI
jgi:hypothetical protein